MPHYFSNIPVTDVNGNIISYQCKNDSPSPEMHPLRWFLTRQIGCMFWCIGEMVADWYPLIRTKAVAKEQKSIWIVYVSCGLFNISKLSLIILHWTLSPTELYDKNGVYQKKKVDLFYFNYWIIHLIIIYSSFIYDFSVYYVVKKSLSYVKTSEISFLKKFKSFSQFRILVTAGVCAVFLPIISVTIIIKFYFYKKYQYHNLEFSFDEIRQSINNVQYFMIFIDQILLIHSNEEETQYSVNISINGISTTDDKKKSISNSSFINYNTLKSNHSNYTLDHSNSKGKNDNSYSTLKSNYSNYTLDHSNSKGKNDNSYNTLKSNYSNYTLDHNLSKGKNNEINHRKLRSNGNSSITLTENSNENQTFLRTNRSNSYSSSYYYDNLNYLNKSNSYIDNQTLSRYNRSNSFSSSSAYNSIHSMKRIKHSNSNLLNYDKNNNINNNTNRNNVDNNTNHNNVDNNTNYNNVDNNKNDIINNTNNKTNHNIINNSKNSIINDANNSTNYNIINIKTSPININNNSSVRQSKIFNCNNNNNNIYTNDNENSITINNNNNIIEYNNFVIDNYNNRKSDIVNYDNTHNRVD